MLNNSTSPQSDLESLCNWLALPETKEVLQYLQDKANLTEVMVKASPLAYKDEQTREQLDAATIHSLRDHFIGEEKGLRHLAKLLAQREEELRAKIKKQEQTT